MDLQFQVILFVLFELIKIARVILEHDVLNLEDLGDEGEEGEVLNGVELGEHQSEGTTELREGF